jgi:hypothetical protein
MLAFIFSLVFIMLLANPTNHCFKVINSKNYVMYSSFKIFLFNFFNIYYYIYIYLCIIIIFFFLVGTIVFHLFKFKLQ